MTKKEERLKELEKIMDRLQLDYMESVAEYEELRLSEEEEEDSE